MAKNGGNDPKRAAARAARKIARNRAVTSGIQVSGRRGEPRKR